MFGRTRAGSQKAKHKEIEGGAPTINGGMGKQIKLVQLDDQLEVLYRTLQRQALFRVTKLTKCGDML